MESFILEEKKIDTLFEKITAFKKFMMNKKN